MSKELAIKYFSDGYCCSESVIKATLETLDYNSEEIDLLTKSGSPFCGGMGIKSVCGVVTGCGIVLGAHLGKAADPDRLPAKLMKELVTIFEEKHNSIECEDLIAPFSDERDKKRAYCASLVASGTEILLELINKVD